MSQSIDTSVLDALISGRVVPHIYAFKTSEKHYPQYLKVGDTYRPVERRLKEWEVHFEGLKEVFRCKAVIDGTDVYFRDYSVHEVLKGNGFTPLKPEEAVAKGAYFSNEFFFGAEKKDVASAVDEVKSDYKEGGLRFCFYGVKDLKSKKPEEDKPVAVELKLRPNQKDAVEAFEKARAAGRDNLLMYAVMRFGKTVTALSCAKAMNARFVVVVSGKADVFREWQNAVLGFTCFKDYVFVAGKELGEKYDNSYVAELLKAGKKVVYFDTLQDFCDKGGKVDIKPKHRQIFRQTVDLLIVDETHYAARAKECGKILSGGKPTECCSDDKPIELDEETAASAMTEVVSKVLKAKIRLHLSGTPYRILMGSEFTKDDLVSFCQFTDIIKAQKDWDREYLGQEKKDDSGNFILNEKGEHVQYEEWDNPYFGFPEMVRFAFNLNESSRKKLEELEKQGVSSKFGELFKTKSLRRDKAHKLHKQFAHEDEVVELLQVIGGVKEDAAILPFLDYPKIKEGGMCHHIVCVLPWKAACDAMEALLSKRNRRFSGKFGRLGGYKVLNIAGFECGKGIDSPEKVIKVIADAEERGEKTITLTVDKMLTGNTVPEWDTMLFLKDSSSPQMYDQAIFRLQSSFTKRRQDGKGHTIVYNMKPQTLLVDFDPNRMFRLQEERAQVYNANVGTKGNEEAKARIGEELAASPIVRLDEAGIHKVSPSDIIAAVCEYSSKKGVADEVDDIPVGRGELTDPRIRAFVEKLPAIGSKEGLTINPHEGDKTEEDIPDADGGKGGTDGTDNLPPREIPTTKKEYDDIVDRLKTYRVLIVFFAFLSQDRMDTFDVLIDKIDSTDDNRRIAKHLGLEKGLLEIYRRVITGETHKMLDRKIHNIDLLANESGDIDLGDEYRRVPKVVKKAIVAMRKFGRLGEAKIVTPPNIAYDMVKQIPAAELKKLIESGEKILDPASKMGEFAIAIVRRCTEPDINLKPEALKDAILAIPMCGVTYEFTRKVYELLGLDVKCIAQPENMTSYDLLKVKKADGKSLDYEHIKSLLTQNKNFNTIKIDDDVAEGEQTMCKKIGLMISNPPYQIDDGGNGRSATSIFPDFVGIGKTVVSKYTSLIMPAKWYSGGKGLDDFRCDMLGDKRISHLVDFADSHQCFGDSADVAGGVCYFLFDKQYNGLCECVNFDSHGKKTKTLRDLCERSVFVRHPIANDVVRKVVSISVKFMSDVVSSRKPFGLPTNATPLNEGDIDLRTNAGWFKYRRSDISVGADLIDKWNVMMSYLSAEHAGQPDSNGMFKILSSLDILPPGSVCTETYILAGSFTQKRQASYLEKYLKTRFVRFLVGQIATTQHVTRNSFSFVPQQDFTSSSDINWSRPIPEIDAQLYAKYGLTEAEQRFIESMIKPME